MDAPVNALILGGGGREHAIARSLSESREIRELHCAPGNPGIEEIASVHPADPCDADEIVSLCVRCGIGLVVVGPEAPLVAGVPDALRSAGVSVFGPGASGARLEGSKAFAKAFMKRHGVPTASFAVCETAEECEEAISRREPPFVIKADGLAAGKGVFLPGDPKEALSICRELLAGSLGDAGRRIVVEDYLSGRELTVFALSDGKSFKPLAPSRDHKRAYDGDEGPNTGGMGAYAPVRLADGIMSRVIEEALRPTFDGLRADGIDYRGVLYVGLMLGDEGPDARISVVEYNARFGDPETQVVLPLMRGDFGLLARKCADGGLADCPDPEIDGNALCVVLASGGYPGDFRKGLPITSLDTALGDGMFVFHSGTARNEDGAIVTNGGRVLSAVGIGPTFQEARDRAYGVARTVSFDDMRYRRDIGWSEK
jgi:phosphoribosylamine--glycine ligase